MEEHRRRVSWLQAADAFLEDTRHQQPGDFLERRDNGERRADLYNGERRHHRLRMVKERRGDQRVDRRVGIGRRSTERTIMGDRRNFRRMDRRVVYDRRGLVGDHRRLYLSPERRRPIWIRRLDGDRREDSCRRSD